MCRSLVRSLLPARRINVSVSFEAWRGAALTALGPPPRILPTFLQDKPIQLPLRQFSPVQVRMEQLEPKQRLRPIPPNEQSGPQQPILRHFKPRKKPLPPSQSKPMQPLNMQPSPTHLPFVQFGPMHRRGMQLAPLQMPSRQSMPEQPKLTHRSPVSCQSLFQV